jgi:O-antigen/teichoic acid export membrane protein
MPTAGDASEDVTRAGTAPRPARFRRAVGQITIVNVAVLLGGFVTGPIQARALGPSGRGELAAIIVPVTLAPFIFGLGLDSYVARVTARRGAVGRAMGSSLLLAAGAGLACSLLAYPISRLIGHGRSTVELFILIGLLLMPVSAVTQTSLGLVWGAQDWRRWIPIRLAPMLISLVALVVLALLDELTVTSAAIAFLASGYLGSVPVIGAVRASRPWSVNREELRAALRYGSRSSGANLIRTANVRLDQVLLAGLVPARELGYYAVAVTLSTYGSTVTGALESVLFPRVAAGERFLAARALRTTTALMLIINVVLAVAAPLIVRILFGSAFDPLVPMFRLLLVANLFLAAAGILNAALTGDGDPGSSLRAEALALGVTLPVLIVLAPSTGGVGAAAISIGTYGIAFGVLLTRSTRRFQLRWQSFLIPTAADLDAARAALRRRLRRPGLNESG